MNSKGKPLLLVFWLKMDIAFPALYLSVIFRLNIFSFSHNGRKCVMMDYGGECVFFFFVVGGGLSELLVDDGRTCYLLVACSTS